jgi:predicted nucleotidyltransferase
MNSTPGVKFIDKRTLSRDEIMAHIRDRLLAARHDVVGIILFGSFARGEPWHDIDVLVVLRERIPTRKAWATIMRQCQDAIGLYNLDLIPTHLDGLRQGLAEHVFILMDVAFDGLVIYGGETIERLLREAREEITARGIWRTDTGGCHLHGSDPANSLHQVGGAGSAQADVMGKDRRTLEVAMPVNGINPVNEGDTQASLQGAFLITVDHLGPALRRIATGIPTAAAQQTTDKPGCDILFPDAVFLHLGHLPDLFSQGHSEQ